MCMSFPLQAVTNFVMYKFGSLKQAEWQTMYDLAKMFLYCFNHWKLETPAIHARSSPTDDQRAYKENHARYGHNILYVHVYMHIQSQHQHTVHTQGICISLNEKLMYNRRGALPANRK